ncbi:Uncharacterized protein YukJ [Singulisphaera sp. GP187]|uniref:DUF2278 family protein n=1 Tax=Singulisphaera sp. GP187 TaxID=1882752 RepID=UPI0009283AF4|nr:DUF2278 family protein [Singulisphaera sp. GP187]SIO20011.1 Uncharacterized protein YukJ [Singulisphaera sp. GP187]
MALTYGFVKCKVAGDPQLKSSPRPHEIQYHLHAALDVASRGGGAPEKWDIAINVGTSDSDDLLRYRLIFDFQSALRDTLKEATPGFHDLTGSTGPPALDFLRGDVLKATGPWRNSDVMDGTGHPEPTATLSRLLLNAKTNQYDVYVFGRTYKSGGLGIHDIHMNQGSRAPFLNNGVDDRNDHNDIWQDGAVLVDLGTDQWAGYFTAFTQQTVPTNNVGNPESGSHPIGDSDPGGMVAR